MASTSRTAKSPPAWAGGLFRGADDEARTRDLNLGKVALYQLSYVRTALLRESNYTQRRSCGRRTAPSRCTAMSSRAALGNGIRTLSFSGAARPGISGVDAGALPPRSPGPLAARARWRRRHRPTRAPRAGFPYGRSGRPRRAVGPGRRIRTLPPWAPASDARHQARSRSPPGAAAVRRLGDVATLTPACPGPGACRDHRVGHVRLVHHGGHVGTTGHFHHTDHVPSESRAPVVVDRRLHGSIGCRADGNPSHRAGVRLIEATPRPKHAIRPRGFRVRKRPRSIDRGLPLWSGRRGSNSRPQPWQGCALPTELRPHCSRPALTDRCGHQPT